ncbi:MAG: CHAD domain-containing protein [Actinomycetota bacterium]|nr:CHAD domain-containing protein [Actinomycetota bacterium]
MATGLSLHEPVAALQRDLVELLRKSVDDLGDAATPLDARVHELRKRMKRARAWAQILPAPLGRTVDRALRDVHRRLGARRDLDATLEALTRLGAAARARGRDDARDAMHAVRERLRNTLSADATAQVVAGVRDDLDNLARVIGNKPLHGDFPLVADGVAAIARRSRHAMRRALASGEARDYHRWRKWMKYHWFHLRYLAPLWPELLRVEATAAEHAAEWLGESQDIELVRRAIDDTPLPPAQYLALVALVDREQQRLLRQAASVGLHLHAETPRAFERRIGNYWKARLYRRTSS